MSFEFILTFVVPLIVATLASAGVGKLVQSAAARASESLAARLERWLGVAPPDIATATREEETAPYAARFSTLAQSLMQSAQEADRIIQEMADVVREQDAKRLHLEQEVQTLSRREAEVKERVETMSKEDIVGLLVEQERRHAGEKKADTKRDYRLFLLGVGVSAVCTVIAALLAVATHHLGWT